MEVLSILLLIIFIALGGIHFYWIFGGKWGLENALPTNENGKDVLKPNKFATLIVGTGLTIFGVFYLFTSGLVNVQMPSWVLTYGGWIVPTIFMLRAIGDFKYVGFFKRIKHTDFGRMDSKLFSPLCLTIGIIGMLIQLLKIEV